MSGRFEFTIRNRLEAPLYRTRPKPRQTIEANGAESGRAPAALAVARRRGSAGAAARADQAAGDVRRPAAAMNITIVCVTYGNRAHLLMRVLNEARAQGAANAIIIDNGSPEPVAPILAARFPGWAHVETLGANRGSALGYKTGIQLAMARGAECLLLLDDDNVPADLCLRALADHWLARIAAGDSPGGFAVHAMRPGMNAGDSAARLHMAEPRRGSFMGFHIADMPYKVLRRLTPGLLRRGGAVPPAATEVSIASYGGMLFHRDVIGRIGLPDEAFFLYVDDYEFAARLTATGGKIHLLRDAVIHDIDTTWGSMKVAPRSALFTARLEMQNFNKLYYATRNLTYFEFHLRAPRSLVYLLNAVIFLSILSVLALSRHRLPQYLTMLQAMQDGRRRSLGMNQAYQL